MFCIVPFTASFPRKSCQDEDAAVPLHISRTKTSCLCLPLSLCVVRVVTREKEIETSALDPFLPHSEFQQQRNR